MEKVFQENWWRRVEITNILHEHFKLYVVGLFIAIQKGNTIEHNIYTGFLRKYLDKLYWVTAGHNAIEISGIKKQLHDKVLKCVWIDNCDINDAQGIVVDINTIDIRTEYPGGYDIGCIQLSLYETGLIEKFNKAFHLSTENWVEEEIIPEGIYIVGYPKMLSTLHSDRVNKKQILHKAEMRLIMLPMEKAPREDEDLPFWRAAERFIKPISFVNGPEQIFEEYSGFSGSPVIGINHNEQGKIGYLPYGIFKSRHPSRDIFAIDNFEYLNSIINKLFNI